MYADFFFRRIDARTIIPKTILTISNIYRKYSPISHPSSRPIGKSFPDGLFPGLFWGSGWDNGLIPGPGQALGRARPAHPPGQARPGLGPPCSAGLAGPSHGAPPGQPSPSPTRPGLTQAGPGQAPDLASLANPARPAGPGSNVSSDRPRSRHIARCFAKYMTVHNTTKSFKVPTKTGKCFFFGPLTY